MNHFAENILKEGAKTATYGQYYRVSIPEDVHLYVKVHTAMAKSTLRDWAEEAMRELLRARRAWEPSFKFELFPYRPIPKAHESGFQQLYFGTDENFGEIVKEQAALDGVRIQDFVWTAIYNAATKMVQAE